MNIHLHATTWKTLAATSSSRPNPEALAAREVLAHPHLAFHPCTCGLCGGAVVLIDYNDMEIVVRMTTRRRQPWSTSSSTPTPDYVGPLLQLFFRCSARLVVMIYDILVASILGWYGRSSASVVYLYPYSGIRSILHSSWSGCHTIVIRNGYKGLEWTARCDQNISLCSLSIMCATCLYQLESPSGETMHIVSRLSQ
jgi:hypothetical protein